MADGPAYTLDDVSIEASRLVYEGFFKLQKIQLKHKMMEGGWSASVTRECFLRQPAVAVLPYDPYQDKVVLIEQFRIGALQQVEGPWQIELVAGMMEKGESAEEVAVRETVEEAGTEVMDLEFICDFLPSAGGSNEKINLFCGAIDARGVGGVHGLEEEGEDIWVQTYSREDALHALHEGYIKSAPAIIALQWLEVNYGRLQEKWR